MTQVPHTMKFDCGVEANFYTPAETFHDEGLESVIQALAEISGVESPVVILPDVSRKAGRVSPTGIALATRNTIIPSAVPAANGSGVRVALLDLDETECQEPLLDNLLRELALRVPIYGEDSPGLLRPRLREEDLLQIYRGGVPWLSEKLDFQESLNQIEAGGRFDVGYGSDAELRSAIPDFLFEQGLYNFGILESGNHFIEIQIVEEILDNASATPFGIKQGQAVLMIHDGNEASLVGQYFHPTVHTNSLTADRFEADKRSYHRRFLENDRSCRYFRPSSPFFGIDEQDEAHPRFLGLMGMACNYGLANRAYLQTVVLDALRSAFRRTDIHATTLTDTLHDCVKKTEVGEQTFMVHRHGATEARPAKTYTENHPFSQTGQLVGIPGAPGRPSILAAAKDTAATWFTANHGAGRCIDRSVARRRFDERASLAAVQAQGAQFLRGGLGRFAGENPEAYKEVDQVLSIAESAGLLRGVARLRPVAIYKG